MKRHDKLPANSRPNGDSKQRDRYDKINTSVAVVGLVALIGYTTFAGYQSCQMKHSVDQQVMSNRPVMYHNGVDWSDNTPRGSVGKKVRINWNNFGRSLAVTVVTEGHIFVRSPEEPAPIDPDCDENIKAPKSGRADAVAPDGSATPDVGPADGENLNDVTSGKALYVSGCVYYYGIDKEKRYFSDLCVRWVPTEPQDFKSCEDPKRNYAH